MSSSVYNHRSLAPNASVTRGGGGPEGHARLNEAFETIRAEYDVLFNEIGVIKSQRDEAEAKMAAQVNELNIIRQTLYDLEGNHHKIRGQYEDELGRLRAELQAYKSLVAEKEAGHPLPGEPGGGRAAPPPPSRAPTNGPTHRESRYSYRDHGPPPAGGSGPISPSLGPGAGKELPLAAPSRAPPAGPPSSRAPVPPEERAPRGGDERGPPPSARGSLDERLPAVRPHMFDDSRKDEGRPGFSTPEHNHIPPSRSGIDRGGYERGEYGPSRHEREDRMTVDPPAPPPAPAAAPVERPTPVESKPPPTNSSTPQAGSTAPSSGTVGFPNDFLDIDSVPAEFRKEGSDWYALFNPSTPRRTLDVSLVHTLMHESVVCCVRFSADGKYLATGCNRTAQIYDVKTGIKTCILTDESAAKSGDLYIRSVCFSPDGKYLATGAEDKQIRIWDISKRRIRNIFDGHQQEIYSLDFSANGKVIVSGSGDKTARIWDMENGTSKVLVISDQDSMGGDAGVTSVAISPDGRYVAAGSLDTVVRIWDVASGRLLNHLRGHRDSVYSVAFTPDGKGLVSGSLDKTLKFWDITSLSKNSTPKESDCKMNFTGHKDYVLSVAVSHDGQWIVSGSKDRGVQFWEANSATVQCMLQGHKNSVISIDLSPKGNMLATGSGDWQARIWSYNS